MGFRGKGRQRPGEPRVEGGDERRGREPERASAAGKGPSEGPPQRDDAAAAGVEAMRLLTRQRPPRALDAEREAAWLERARVGDQDAFDALVRAHFTRVYSLLFRLVGNHEDAEDLAQDVFVKAQRSLGWYRGEARFGTWLYRIAVSLSRDHFRRRGVRALSPAERDDVPEPPSREGAPSDELARRELVRALRDALDRLPHRLRAALVMRTQEGLEYDEIARVLDITPNTARVQVMKARRRLERAMRPWTDGGAS